MTKSTGQRKTRGNTIHTTESLLANTIEEGQCLLWQGYFAYRGVPNVHHDGKMHSVRKLLLEFAGKKKDNTKFYKTSCNNPDCVNPAHIIQHTGKQHMTKMTSRSSTASATVKRRASATRARRSRSDVVGLEKAREIAMSTESSTVLSERYGVGKTTVNRIKRGEIWQTGINPFAGLLR